MDITVNYGTLSKTYYNIKSEQDVREIAKIIIQTAYRERVF
jgi:hypothetical protein